MPSIAENKSADKQERPTSGNSTRSRSGRAKRRACATNPGVAPDLLPYPYTDTGKAERLVAMFGDQIRHCPDMKKWLIWDGTPWKPDRSGEIRRMAKIGTAVRYRLEDLESWLASRSTGGSDDDMERVRSRV